VLLSIKLQTSAMCVRPVSKQMVHFVNGCVLYKAAPSERDFSFSILSQNARQTNG
jgi:hypothetical protein